MTSPQLAQDLRAMADTLRNTGGPPTHHQVSTAARPAIPCAAWHLTFGNRCLNCGYYPNFDGADVLELLERAARRAEGQEVTP